MNNKLTLLLNDKETIAEIARDPEVRIRIKDAILDGALKRLSKLESSIADSVSETLKKEVFKQDSWCKKLNEKYRQAVIDEARNAVTKLVCSEVSELNELVKKEMTLCQSSKKTILIRLLGKR